MYESSCAICHPEEVKDKKDDDLIRNGYGTYIGETSRSLFERTLEHNAAAKILEKESHIAKHWFMDHEDELEPPGFRYKLVGSYKDCLTRQVKEAIRILNRPGSLNSKDEFGRSILIRLTVEQSEYVKKKEQIEQNRKQQEEDESWERFVEKTKSKHGKRKDNTDIEESNYKKRKLDEKKNDHPDKLDENIPEGWREGQTE